MLREIVSASPAGLEKGRPAQSRAGLVALALCGLCTAALALAFALLDPPGNRSSAAVLIAALGLDGLGRLASRLALRGRAGPPSGAVPSIVLASDRGAIAASLLFAAAALTWPGRFPVLASLLAGLTAMGGIARLVIAWTVFRASRGDDDE